MTRWFTKTSEDWRHQWRFTFWHKINSSPLRMKEERNVPPSWETFHRKSQSLKEWHLLFKKGVICALHQCISYLSAHTNLTLDQILCKFHKMRNWNHISIFQWEEEKVFCNFFFFGLASSSWHISSQVMYPWRSNRGFNSPWDLSTFQLSL